MVRSRQRVLLGHVIGSDNSILKYFVFLIGANLHTHVGSCTIIYQKKCMRMLCHTFNTPLMSYATKSCGKDIIASHKTSSIIASIHIET